MNELLSFVLLVAIVVHGYFYIKYETVHPCRAAVVRALEDKEPLFAVGARALVGDAVSDNALRIAGKALASERGFMFCYRVALLGTPGHGVRPAPK